MCVLRPSTKKLNLIKKKTMEKILKISRSHWFHFGFLVLSHALKDSKIKHMQGSQKSQAQPDWG